MNINLTHPNPSLISIIEYPEQIITLDANFLIPPDRSWITKRGIEFEQFKAIWLDPIFSAFPNQQFMKQCMMNLLLSLPKIM